MLEVHGAEAGMHLAVTMPKGIQKIERSSERAAEHGLQLWPLSPCYYGDAVRQGLILGFGSTPAKRVPRAVSQLRSMMIG